MAIDAAAARMELRYYAYMLSTAAVATALCWAAAWMVDHMRYVADLLARIAVVLGGVNLAGALIIYRPIRRLLRGETGEREAFERRVGALPALSGLWSFVLAAVVLLGHASAMHGSWVLFEMGPPIVLLGIALQTAVFAAYLGLYAFFVTVDFTTRLRELAWHMGHGLAPARGRLSHRLVAAFVAVAVAPILIRVSDRWIEPLTRGGPGVDSAGTHHFMRQALELDVLGAVLVSGIVVVTVARSLARPIEILLGAMQRVDRGDYAMQSPVVSDDELGLLTDRFNRMLDGLRERDRIRRTFGRFVPASVAAALLADEGAIAPQEREATVLFTDIEGFTRIAAQLAPRKVVEILNAYFSRVAEIIHQNHGVITQFQGDAVLATFNLPASDPDHARHALETAVRILDQLDHVAFDGSIHLRTRIGICTGQVVGGTVGGGDRLGYTVHGDTVNLAARLEALNKQIGTRILLSARTAELAGPGLELRHCGAVPVRGFAEPLSCYTTDLPQRGRSTAATSDRRD